MEQLWRKFDGTPIGKSIEMEISNRIAREQAAGHELNVCIGTDSQVKGRITEFATVIVVIRKGKGGFMYILPDVTDWKMSIRQRMLIEVEKSIDTAYKLSGILTRYRVAMEVHADINTNPKFKSNEALKEAMSYIMSMGFVFRAKPYAFASSSCANKVVQ